MRYYLVKNADKDAPNKSVYFVEARSPKDAARKVADRVVCSEFRYGSVIVRPMTDGCYLGQDPVSGWGTKTYSVDFRREVCNITRSSS